MYPFFFSFLTTNILDTLCSITVISPYSSCYYTLVIQVNHKHSPTYVKRLNMILPAQAFFIKYKLNA